MSPHKQADSGGGGGSGGCGRGSITTIGDNNKDPPTTVTVGRSSSPGGINKPIALDSLKRKKLQHTNGIYDDDDNDNDNKIRGQLERRRHHLATMKQQKHIVGLHDSLTPVKGGTMSTLCQIGEDWLYLALLGIIMALLSFSMDFVITLLLETRLWFSLELGQHGLMWEYLAWCLIPVLLVTFGTGFVHLCSPTAIGSGIPEMKTILRGVVLNEYLTFRTLIAKIVGLTFTLGSGLPLGKEGPFVHMASIVATLLSKLVASFQGIYENESRTSEMLSAACAVGVAATFYAPIGGVLFSIEVTTVYFAVRNYWRGFFAACCGATVWRLLSFYIKNDESITALFKTNFSTDYPFDPIELLVFSFIGATCGLGGAAYIKFHRLIVQFFRRHKRISGFFQKNRFVYPILITSIITTTSFPPLLGQFTASTLSTHTTIEHLFSNRTWGLGKQDLTSQQILDHWTADDTSFYVHLVLYIAMLFWTSALASTIPIPSGIFIPVLKMGAAYGRLVGELMAMAYPNGVKYGGFSHPAFIVPGSYAVVGAAAFSGAVTHTISTSVILFEMTGQIVHIIPVILGVLIANAVCQSLQPSIYDSIIEIKKLPYLPPIASSNSISHKILVRDFMNTDIPYVWKEKFTYADLKATLSAHKKIISFPLVESPKSMKLLGSVARPDLLKLLYLHLNRDRRLQEVCRRNSDTLTPAINLLTSISGRLADEEAALKAERRATQTKSLAIDNNNKNININESTTTEDENGSRDEAKLSVSSDRGIEMKLERSSSSSSSSTLSSDESTITTTDNTAADTANGVSSGSNAPDDNNDATRLIILASQPAKANYGSTLREKTSPMADANAVGDSDNDIDGSPKLITTTRIDVENYNGGPVLSECHKESDSGEDEENGHVVAKLVNHYNRGSSMDEDQLNESIQVVEDQIANNHQSPCDVVMIVSETNTNNNNNTNDSQPDETTSNNSFHANSIPTPNMRRNRSRLAVPNEFERSLIRYSAPLSPLVELKQSSSFVGHVPSSPSLSSRPTKSILKTTNSAIGLSKRNISSQSFSSTYGLASNGGGGSSSNTLVENNNFSKSSNVRLKFLPVNDGCGKREFYLGDSQSGRDETAPVRQRRKVRLPRLRVVDMTPEEQEQWEKEQLNAYIDISKCQIDEAPFQLVEQTSLYRVHTLFSMLGLNHAYVTSFGKLVGIVGLKDIRLALEKILQEK